MAIKGCRKNLYLSKEVLDRINLKGGSRYVTDLVLKDMDEENDYITKKEVLRLIKQYGLGEIKNQSSNVINADKDVIKSMKALIGF